MAKKENEAVLETEGMDADHAEKRVYELGFHIDADLPAEEAKKTYQAVRSVIAGNGAVVAEGEPQKIPLAYTISRSEPSGRRDFDSSFFAWIAYEADGAGHQAVTDAAKEESRIFRFIDLRTTKEEAQHAAEMHELMAKASQGEGAEGEVSDTELDNALKEVAA